MEHLKLVTGQCSNCFYTGPVYCVLERKYCSNCVLTILKDTKAEIVSNEVRLSSYEVKLHDFLKDRHIVEDRRESTAEELITYFKTRNTSLLHGWGVKRIKLFSKIVEGLYHNEDSLYNDVTYLVRPWENTFLVYYPIQRKPLTVLTEIKKKYPNYYIYHFLKVTKSLRGYLRHATSVSPVEILLNSYNEFDTIFDTKDLVSYLKALNKRVLLYRDLKKFVNTRRGI